MSRDASKCPVTGGGQTRPMTNRDWWPDQLDLKILHQNPPAGDPMGEDFDYAEEFKKLDLEAVKKDLYKLMTDSQPWWPADYGHYGGLFIRMAWHSAGTYRIQDGRGGASSGTQRFAPLASWPDNANLDKARRLLWPIKQKYGKKISWADLMILAGNCALESMGFKTFGFAGGREDVWEPEQDIDWGTETEWLGDKRYHGDRVLENPYGAVQMGLIYVNPEGPNAKPDPVASGRDIRETFARMAMNDEETVALTAGGHTFGKGHGAGPDGKYVDREPDGAPIEEQGFGWKNRFGTGLGDDTISSGIEGAWTPTPTTWDMTLLRHALRLRVGVREGPRRPLAVAREGCRREGHGAGCARPVEEIPAHDDHRRHGDADGPEVQQDLATLPQEPQGVRRRLRPRVVQADPPRHGADLALPRPRGPEEAADLAGPRPERRPQADREEGHRRAQEADPRVGAVPLRSRLHRLGRGLELPQLRQARRGERRPHPPRAAEGLEGERAGPGGEGAQGSREDPEGLQRGAVGGKKVSLADLIVLGGCAAVEQAAKDAGVKVEVPFAPGRTDASQSQTDAASFAPLELKADGFRNYLAKGFSRPAEHLLVDRAQLLSLTAPEMTVLVGGLRVLGANHGESKHGVFTDRPGALTNDFFVNLLDMGTEWKKSKTDGVYEGRDRATGKRKWTGTRVDLVFGSNSQLRALAEVYACEDSKKKFVHDFVSAWDKVMNLDRFDLA